MIDVYALTLATTVLAAGSLADLFGRRLVFTVGLAVFTIASFACGIAGNAGVLIGARAVQGVGGGIMFATSLALLANAFHGRERGTAFGIWGATTGAAVAIGPLVGGVLTETAGWRWIFFVNVPIGIAAVIGTILRVDESRDPASGRVDWLGTISLTGTYSCSSTDCCRATTRDGRARSFCAVSSVPPCCLRSSSPWSWHRPVPCST